MGVVLELVNAQPIGRMVERIDGGARSNRAKRADRAPSREAIFVHAGIVADAHFRPELSILVEELRASSP
jgi:hypothetical protein